MQHCGVRSPRPQSPCAPTTPKRSAAKRCDELEVATPSTTCSDSSPKRFREADESPCSPSNREMRVCRFCLDSEEIPFDLEAKTTAGTCTDPFVAPCPCRGSTKFVHMDCLEQHFAAQRSWHNFKCPTCKQTYEGRALRRLAEISRDRMVQDHGPRAPQVAHSLCYLAQAHAQLGSVQESKEVLELGLEMTEAHYGRGHVATAATLAELATAYGKLGDVQTQKQFLQRSLQIKEQHFGEGHINTAVTLNNLATAYSELGDVQQEKVLLERSLDIKERHYGKGSVQTTAALVNLAGVYSELGEVARGRDLLESALDIEERHFGAGHVETAITLNNLALACGEGGDVQRMQELLVQCLTIKENHFGSNHQELCLTLANLGMACGALGQNVEAQRTCERAIANCSTQRSSRRYGVVLLRSASVHAALEQESLAQELLGRAVDVLQDALGSAASSHILELEGIRMGRIWSEGGRADVAAHLQAMLKQCSTYSNMSRVQSV